MFIKPIHKIWKLTVETVYEESNHSLFKPVIKRTAYYFKTKQDAMKFHHDKFRDAEVLLEKIDAIENQGKWWEVIPIRFKKQCARVFHPTIKSKVKPGAPEMLIGVKDEFGKDGGGRLDGTAMVYPVDFSSEAKYYLHVHKKYYEKGLYIDDVSQSISYVVLGSAPFMLTQKIDPQLYEAAQQPPPPAPSAPSMEELGIKITL